MSPTLRQNVCATETEDGMVLLDERSGHYFKLNPSGALILQALLKGTPAAEIAGALTARYEVSEEQAARDVGALADQLCARGLVIR